MAFDGIVIANLVHDLKYAIEGGRISKIAQPEKDELLFQTASNTFRPRSVLSARCCPEECTLFLRLWKRPIPLL